MNAVYLLAIISVFVNTASLAQPGAADAREQLQRLLDRVPLPEAYSLECDRIGVGSFQDGQVVSRFRMTIGPDWVVSLQLMLQPGIGEVPVVYGYANPAETWRYHLDRQQVVRSQIFARRAYDSSETLTSVTYIIRALRENEARDIKFESHEDGTITVALTHEYLSRAMLTFDTNTGFLTRLQVYDRSGKRLQLDDRFNDWRYLSDEAAIPFEIESEMVFSTETIRSRAVVTKAELLKTTSQPGRIPVSSSFTIIDEVEGVTKRADGTVIGPIERASATAGVVRTRPPSFGWLSSRTVMLVGIGLILLAGIVFGIKRWKGV